MIYTLTVNPSLDYFMEIENLELGKVNRSCKEKLLPGGKGINVSLMLNNLGIKNKAFGFLAGFTGKQIEKTLKKEKVKTDFIYVDGLSRINVKAKSNIEETELNANGLDVNPKKQISLLKKVSYLKNNDILVVSGNVPTSLGIEFYNKILKQCNKKNVKIVLDVNGKCLKDLIRFKPFVIKPNIYELEELFDVKVRSREEVISYGKKLNEMGISNVLISLGGQGAVLVSENNKVYDSFDLFTNGVPECKQIINTVASGDSMLAGFLAGLEKGNGIEYAFKLAICAGSASASVEWLATEEEIMDMMLK